VLKLDHNFFGGAFTVSLNDVVMLLSQSSVGSSISASIGYLTNLIELDLSYNSLTGSIPSSFSSLVNLVQLNLAHNLLTSSLPANLDDIKQLAYLRVDGNKLSGNVPGSICGHLTLLYLFDGSGSDNTKLTCYAPCLTTVVVQKYGSLNICGASDNCLR
jgi:Leucine rich repeat